MMNWEIIASKSMLMEADGLWLDSIRRYVLSIERNEWGDQRARLTDGVNSWKRDVAWAWEQFNE